MIGGNITAQLQIKNTSTKNAIGERTTTWATMHLIKGFIDLSNGDSNHVNFNTKIQESTHIFICDYLTLDSSIVVENSRMIINNKSYDILLIDDPMKLKKQLEFYLKYTGGQ